MEVNCGGLLDVIPVLDVHQWHGTGRRYGNAGWDPLITQTKHKEDGNKHGIKTKQKRRMGHCFGWLLFMELSWQRRRRFTIGLRWLAGRNITLRKQLTSFVSYTSVHYGHHQGYDYHWAPIFIFARGFIAFITSFLPLGSLRFSFMAFFVFRFRRRQLTDQPSALGLLVSRR